MMTILYVREDMNQIYSLMDRETDEKKDNSNADDYKLPPQSQSHELV